MEWIAAITPIATAPLAGAPASPTADNSLSLVAVGISGVALGLSLAALTWQVVSWVWAGPRIRVTSFSGIVAGQPQHPEALLLVASNRGRMPATIDQWGFIIKGSLHGVAAWMSSPEVLTGSSRTRKSDGSRISARPG